MENVEYRGFSIEIHQDENAESPREFAEPFGKMIAFHSRYWLGDEHSFDKDDFLGDNLMDGFEKGLRANGINPVIILPLYLYDHSGLSISASNGYPYNDRWDAGCVGFTYADRDMMLKEFSNKRISKKAIEKATKLLLAEVETYDDYLRGNVFGYVVEDMNGFGDSCWGYYGLDHEESGLLESARNAIDCEISSRRKAHFKKLSQWVRNRVPLDKREPCPSFA